MKYSKCLAENVTKLLDEKNLKYRFDEENGIFSFPLSPDLKDSFIKSLSYLICVREDDFTVYARVPFGPDERMLEQDRMKRELSYFLHKANYGIANGCFEMDIEDGELRYKTFVDCEGMDEVSEDVFDNCIGVCYSMIRRYSSGILHILVAGGNASDAIELCESKIPGLNEDAVMELLEEVLS